MTSGRLVTPCRAQEGVKGSQIACRDEQTEKAADKIHVEEAQSRPRGEAAKSDRSRSSRRLFWRCFGAANLAERVAGERRRAVWLLVTYSWLWWATPFPIRHLLLLVLLLTTSVTFTHPPYYHYQSNLSIDYLDSLSLPDHAICLSLVNLFTERIIAPCHFHQPPTTQLP